MPRWLPRILARIRELATERRVQITDKARREIQHLNIGLDREDVCDLLAALREHELSTRVASEVTGEWLYVFKPNVAGLTVYVKLIVRANCVVVSFHEDAGNDD